MLMDDVYRVYRGWRKAPPTHRLVAAFMGVKPEAEKPAQAVNAAALDAFLAETTAAFSGRPPGV